MYRSTVHFSRRAAFAFAFTGATLTAAGAATFHRFAVSQTTGSGGATAFLQSSTSGGALQGDVGTANTAIKYPFGVAGVIDAPTSAPFGIGVIGLSTTGYGIGAESTAAQPAIFADGVGGGVGIQSVTPSSSSSEAIFAQAQGTGDGIDATAQSGTGIAAGSGTGIAVSGFAGTGEGVVGESVGSIGVEGDSFSSSFADGVYGTSENGDAVHGDVSSGHAGVVGTNEGSGFGVYATSGTGIGAEAVEKSAASPTPSQAPSTYAGMYGQSQNGPGIYGVNTHDSGSPIGFGINTNGRADFFPAIYGYANDGAGIFTYSVNDAGAYITNAGNVPTLVIDQTNGSSTNDLIAAVAGNPLTTRPQFTVDTAGDVTAAGNVTAQGNIYYAGSLVSDAAPRGAAVSEGTYATQQTEATVEDVGSAQLVGGGASVPIAADYRATIDTSEPYMVFLTPDGPSHGLYVAAKSSAGFVVRENDGGRATIPFDYRIVAHPYGKHLARLPRVKHESALAGTSYSIAGHRAAFDGAAPDTMAVSRAADVTLRAHVEALRKAARIARAQHRYVRGTVPPTPPNLFTSLTAHP